MKKIEFKRETTEITSLMEKASGMECPYPIPDPMTALADTDITDRKYALSVMDRLIQDYGSLLVGFMLEAEASLSVRIELGCVESAVGLNYKGFPIYVTGPMCLQVEGLPERKSRVVPVLKPESAVEVLTHEYQLKNFNRTRVADGLMGILEKVGESLGMDIEKMKKQAKEDHDKWKQGLN